MKIKSLLAGAAFLLTSTFANAHIVGIGYTAEANGDISIFAATYHLPQALAGGCLSIDGSCYNWESQITYGSLDPNSLDGFVNSTNTSSVRKTWLTVTVSNLVDGLYDIKVIGANAVDYLWPNFSPSLNIDVVEQDVSAPSTIALLGFGLLGLVYRRKRA